MTNGVLRPSMQASGSGGFVRPRHADRGGRVSRLEPDDRRGDGGRVAISSRPRHGVTTAAGGAARLPRLRLGPRRAVRRRGARRPRPRRRQLGMYVRPTPAAPTTRTTTTAGAGPITAARLRLRVPLRRLRLLRLRARLRPLSRLRRAALRALRRRALDARASLRREAGEGGAKRRMRALPRCTGWPRPSPWPSPAKRERERATADFCFWKSRTRAKATPRNKRFNVGLPDVLA